MSSTKMLTFRSTNKVLEQGFEWAKNTALGYAHGTTADNGLLWYEAALPGRNAFCIRDLAHQSAGAAILGLAPHTFSMLKAFAKSIAKSRDYCMFWEITKDNAPAPVDYTDDCDFWYNLPANFDMLCACYKEYLRTADRRYLEDGDLLNFYRLTVNEYVKQWDKDGDGIPEHYKEYGRRGIASYNEQVFSPYVGGDLLGAMYAGYKAYAAICALRGEDGAEYLARAVNLKNLYLTKWQNNGMFYGALRKKDKFYKKYYDEGNFLPVYFGILDKTDLLDGARDRVRDNIKKGGAGGVEAKSYLPELFYTRGDDTTALRELRALLDPTLKRREYPEVSFAAVATLINCYAGITAEDIGIIRTLSRAGGDTVKVDNLPIQDKLIAVTHSATQTMFANNSNSPVTWQAAFYGNKQIAVDGKPVPTLFALDSANRPYTYAAINVPPLCACTAKTLPQ